MKNNKHLLDILCEKVGCNYLSDLRREQNKTAAIRAIRQLTKEDAEYFDLILCMDLSNIRYAQRLVPLKHHHKIRTLLDRNIADPWYTGNFEETYRDVLSGCTQLLEKL